LKTELLKSSGEIRFYYYHQLNKESLSCNTLCQVVSGSYKRIGGNEWDDLVVSHLYMEKQIKLQMHFLSMSYPFMEKTIFFMFYCPFCIVLLWHICLVFYFVLVINKVVFLECFSPLDIHQKIYIYKSWQTYDAKKKIKILNINRGYYFNVFLYALYQ